MPIFQIIRQYGHQARLASKPISRIIRHDSHGAYFRFHADLVIPRQNPHQPHHRFHAYIRGFVLMVSGLGAAEMASFCAPITRSAAGWLPAWQPWLRFVSCAPTHPPAHPAGGFVSSRSQGRVTPVPGDRAGTVRGTIRGMGRLKAESE
jgi:hypothetical protein